MPSMQLNLTLKIGFTVYVTLTSILWVMQRVNRWQTKLDSELCNLIYSRLEICSPRTTVTAREWIIQILLKFCMQNCLLLSLRLKFVFTKHLFYPNLNFMSCGMRQLCADWIRFGVMQPKMFMIRNL